jgi:hypothetical protein
VLRKHPRQCHANSGRRAGNQRDRIELRHVTSPRV